MQDRANLPEAEMAKAIQEFEQFFARLSPEHQAAFREYVERLRANNQPGNKE